MVFAADPRLLQTQVALAVALRGAHAYIGPMASSIYEFAQLPSARGVAARHAGGSAHARRPLAAGEEPCVGVIYNPRSHGNRGADFDCGLSPQVHIAQPGDRAQLPLALSEFATAGIDLLVVNGGDGTVRDVLTCGAPIFGDDWPAIAVLPKGKTNALTVDLGVPADWSLQHAIAAFRDGGRVPRRPIRVTPLGRDNAGSGDLLGFIFGAGAFTTATRAGQSAHRLGAFNSAAVGATALWGVAQWLFGSRSNPWRRGARMTIGLGANEAPMAHSGQGDPAWRQMLFASTLQTLPAGLAPFGHLNTGLRLAALDQIRRRSAFVIPAVLRGKVLPNLRDRGIHQVATPRFSIDIDDQFILDGEAFPAGRYAVTQGPALEFVTV